MIELTPQMSIFDDLATPHRKTVRHCDLPGDAHFLTFSCYHRLPLLSKDRTRNWLIDAIANARRKHDFRLWAWVIMPEHVHLLIYPTDPECKMSSVLSDIKRPVGQKAIAYMVAHHSSFRERLTVRNRNRTYRRFWQAGPGQDHNVYIPETAHRIVEYIHTNPERRGLAARAEDWYWSSARVIGPGIRMFRSGLTAICRRLSRFRPLDE